METELLLNELRELRKEVQELRKEVRGESNLLTIADAAAQLLIKPDTLRRKIVSGAIRGVKRGKMVWVTREEINRYRTDGNAQPPKPDTTEQEAEMYLNRKRKAM